MSVTDQLPDAVAPKRLRLSAIGLSLAVVAALAVLQSINLWSRYRETVSSTEDHAADLTHILVEHMHSSVETLDASLKQMVLHSTRVGGPAAASDLWLPVLRTAIAGMSHVGSLTVTDAEGVIRHSTMPSIIGQSRRDDFLFTTLAANSNAGVMASKPFRSLTSNRMMIPIGRRLVGTDGSFQGIVVVTLIPEEFRSFYQSVDVGRNGVIWVIHPTGLLFLREPAAANAQSTEVPPTLRAALTQNSNGQLTTPLEPGGPTYIHTWRTLNEPPLTLAVSFNLPEALGMWQRDALLSIALTIFVALALGAASRQLVRQLDARTVAEQALIQRDQELIEAQRVAGLGSVRFVSPNLMARPSPQLAALLELPTESSEITLDTLLERLIEPDRDRLRQTLESCLASGQRYQLEVHAKPANVPERIFRTEGIVEKTGEGETASILAIFQDVTEQRMAEQQLSQSQRMAAIGRLTGGVAHDFNNLLTAIMGYGQIVLRRLGPQDPLREKVDEIVKAGKRASALTSQLLALSRKQVLQPKVLDLNESVIEIEKMLRRLIGEDIELSTKLSPTLARVKADPGQLDQVLINLAVNARDAMPHGGKLFIETGNIELDAHYVSKHLEAKPGPHVMLAVSDTGCGMDKETLSHIFEPFFTTKERGQGTGLGLATVYGIVKQSEGSLWVYSEPGQGTTFKIYLPAINETAEPTETHAPAVASAQGSETILLVEDEEAVRKLARFVLETGGYRVLAAGNAHEALQMFEQYQGRINLMITDVIMPGMSGRELTQSLAVMGHEIKVLYMSGYTDDAIVHHGVLDAGIPFLQKPFTPDSLSLKVREVLDG